MNKESKKFLENYLNTHSPSGNEKEAQDVWEKYLSTFIDSKDIHRDVYHSSYAVLKSGKPDAKKVVIEAHSDEIAWIVTHIEDSGLLRVRRNGGSDNMIAPSRPVLIHHHNGKVSNGVFGWAAIHTRDSSVENGPDQHELYIDLGLKDKDAVLKSGVEVGNLVTNDTKFAELGDYFVAKSLDNKIGGFIIAEVLREIVEKRISLDFDLYIVNSSQEEVGLEGARHMAKKIKPNLALVHDVCHNTTTPKYDKAKHGNVVGGDGASVHYAHQNSKRINSFIREVAKKEDIPLQIEVGSTGNDTVSFFREGIETAMIATPLKYMHSTVEMSHKDDVDSAIRIFVSTLKNLKSDFLN
jgi:putative aminopeptidase FrvX